ncbi:MAG: hypothetical protein INR64_14645 [Caulobacteraceae bacterium]|nr:hypothetical protein [Caulobacter sp.]
MSAMPKILPLVAVAAVGVLAVKAMANAQLLPDLLAPPAAAEGAPAHADAKAAPAKPGVSAMPGAPAPPPPPAPVCQRSAADMAKEAGLSPAELATLQNLGARRGQLDAREQALSTQLALINAASAKLDGKLKAMNDLKAQIQGLMQAADQQSQTEIDRLVVVYEKMKPRDAGALMAALDDHVRVPVASKIAETKPAVMAAILSQMGTAEGKKLTELLAHRYTPQQTLQQALNGQPAPDADKAAATTTTASAAPPGTTPGDDAASPKAARPVRVARRTPPRVRGRAAPAPTTAQAAEAKPAPAAAAAAKPAQIAATPARPVQTAAAPASTSAPKPAPATPPAAAAKPA